MEDALKELRDNIRELTELSTRAEELYKEIKDFSKLNEEERKLTEENLNLTQENLKLTEENRKLDEEKRKEILENWIRIGDTANILRQKRELIEEKRKVIEEKSKEVKDMRTLLSKALFSVNELNVMQLDFIDDKIKSVIESSLEELLTVNDIDDDMLRLLEIGRRVRDSLDDVRLLVLEEMFRKSGKTMLSVYVPCSSPIVKVISTKKNIQESFMQITKITSVDKDTNQHILHDWNKPTNYGVLLESNVLEVSNLPVNSPDSVTMAVKITDVDLSTVRDYMVVFKSEEDWNMITALSQEGYVQFSPPPMKYFFVISTERWESFRVSPHGSVFVSGNSKDVKVTFPPSSLREQCEIDIQVMPPHRTKLSKYKDNNDLTDIVNVSQRLWMKMHGMQQFQKPIVATIPIPRVPSTEEDVDVYLVDWTKDDKVYISKTEFYTRDIVCEFVVDSYSGKSLVALRRKRTNNNWMNDIHHYFLDKGGTPKECNIIMFSDQSTPQTLLVQIVECKRKEEMIKSMSNKDMVPITNAESGAIPIQYGQIIRIDAQGSIKIPLHYQIDYMQIKFTQNEESNRLRFDVDIVDEKNRDRAVLEFRVETKQIYVCPFDAKKWLHQNEPQCVGADSAQEVYHYQGSCLMYPHSGRLFRTVLDRCLLELVENLAFKPAFIRIVQKELFDDVTMNEIEEQKTESEKTKELIKQLKKRDWETYRKFKDCLVEIKQISLKDMLEEVEAKVSKDIVETHEAQRTANVLSYPNLEALANQIPIRLTETLVTHLRVSLDGWNRLIYAGHQGNKLTAEVLFLWRRNCNEDVNEMVSKLAKALKLLNLNHLASELLTASAQNRNLTFK